MSLSDKFWDAKAEAYAKSAISDEESYERKLRETQSLLCSDMRVLEFGCGTGATAVQHASHVQHIDALDISENMLEIGRNRATEANVSNITFARATLAEFNADASSFDVVVGLNVIHLMPKRAAVLREVARVLKPGGVFVSSTACLGNSYLRFIRLLAPLGKLLGLMPDVFVMTESELAAEIESAGFAIETKWHHGIGEINVFIIARKL